MSSDLLPVRSLACRGAAFLVLCLTACGDDSSPNQGVLGSATTTLDAGTSGTSSAVPTHSPVSDAALSASSSAAVPAACAGISLGCAGYNDAESFGGLCLTLAAENNAEVCSAVSEECADYCAKDGVMPQASVETSSLNAETCDEAIGDPCHEFDHGAGLGHVCHQLGHQGNLLGCVALYDECVALCGAETGHEEAEGHDAGSHPEDASSDVQSDAAQP